VLRALQVKPGKHEVVLSFFPKSIDRTETIAYVAYGVLLLILIGGIVRTSGVRTKRQRPDTTKE
jgi:hypothetical protein